MTKEKLKEIRASLKPCQKCGNDKLKITQWFSAEHAELGIPMPMLTIECQACWHEITSGGDSDFQNGEVLKQTIVFWNECGKERGVSYEDTRN